MEREGDGGSSTAVLAGKFVSLNYSNLEVKRSAVTTTALSRC
jgi:hypothetical protein